MENKLNEYKNNWISEVYDELDDLEEFIDEENVFMVLSTIGTLRLLIDDFEDVYCEYERRVIRGEKD